MEIVGNEYWISFSSREISNFNKIFATFLENLTSTGELLDFKVNCNKERIIIQVPACPESFAFITQIIQEIDDFSMSVTSNKITEKASDAKKDESTSIDAETVGKESPKDVKKSQAKQVKEYMLSMNDFTIKDLKNNFSDLSDGTIRNAVHLAKEKGLITAMGKGQYIVNKK